MLFPGSTYPFISSSSNCDHPHNVLLKYRLSGHDAAEKLSRAATVLFGPFFFSFGFSCLNIENEKRRPPAPIKKRIKKKATSFADKQ